MAFKNSVMNFAENLGFLSMTFSNNIPCFLTKIGSDSKPLELFYINFVDGKSVSLF